MSVQNQFSINKCENKEAFQQSFEALQNFTEVFGQTAARKQALKKIANDDQITSTEITRDFLDIDSRPGLNVADFYEKTTMFGPSAKQTAKLKDSFAKLETLFAKYGIRLTEKIADYDSYYETVEEYDTEGYDSESYKKAPVVFNNRENFILGAIAAASQHDSFMVQSAYAQASGELKVRAEFNAKAAKTSLAVLPAIPGKYGKENLFDRNQGLLLQAIAADASYVKHAYWQLNDSGFLRRAYDANPEIVKWLKPQQVKRLKDELHKA